MPHLSRILIVDDEAELRATLTDEFELHDEFEVVEAQSAAGAISLVREAAADAVIMDVGLPDMDGRQAVRTMRAQGFRGPVLMLTGYASEADMILGLEAGANDYLVKPFRFNVLLARLRAHLRGGEPAHEGVLAVGPYSFNPDTKLLVTPGGGTLRLTEKEAAILRYLHHAGQIVDRDTLLQEVWGYNSAGTTHTLETHIYRLRRKIEDDPSNARILVTEAGGYRLVS